MKNNLLFGVALAMPLFFASCAKEGCTDKTALNFKSNAKKDDGTCIYNNVNSQNVTVFQNEWIGDGDGYFAKKTLSILNSDVASSGTVMCYLKEDNDEYIAMPLTMSEGQGNWIRHMLFSHDSNSITFLSYDDDGLSPNPGTTTFKVVCISQKARVENQDVDLTNYQAVKKAFDLID